MKRNSPLKRRTPLKSKTSLKRSSPLRSVSRSASSTAKQMLYEIAKKQWLKKHPQCQYKNCVATWTSGMPTKCWLHHKAGRGKYLCDPRFFMTTCPGHHDHIHHIDVAEATELGYIIPRHEADQISSH